MACSARALAELGSLNGFRAFSRPMAVAPNAAEIRNTASASSSIWRGRRIAKLASMLSMSASPAGRQRFFFRCRGRQQYRAHIGDPVHLCLLVAKAEHRRRPAEY
jgi:hypothetical protein